VSVHLGRIGAPGWRQMAGTLAPNLPWPSGHLSGPDNGAVDYPVRFYALVVDRPGGGPRSGQIYVDDVSVWQGEISAPATPVPGPTDIPAGGTATPTVVGEPPVIGEPLDFPVPTQLDGWETTATGHEATIIINITGGIPPFNVYHDQKMFTTQKRDPAIVFDVGGCAIIHTITVESADGQRVAHDYYIRAPGCD